MFKQNYFVNLYYTALADYNADAAALTGDEIASEERYNKALAEIEAISKDVEQAVNQWGILKAGNRHSDADLLTPEYSLTRDEVQALAQKHRQNYTMLRILSVYIRKVFGDDSGIQLVTLDGKKAAYSAIHESAVEMANRIHTAPVEDSVLDEWMNTDESRSIYAQISNSPYQIPI